MVTVLFIAVWWIFWLSLGKINRTYSLLWYSVLGLFLCIVGVWTYRAYIIHLHPIAWTTAATPVRMGPHEQYAICAQLGSGEHVQVVKKYENWYQVSKEDMKGWVPKSVCTLQGDKPR